MTTSTYRMPTAHSKEVEASITETEEYSSVDEKNESQSTQPDSMEEDEKKSVKRKLDFDVQSEKQPKKKRRVERTNPLMDGENSFNIIKMRNFDQDKLGSIMKQLTQYSEEINFVNRANPTFKKLDVVEVPVKYVRILLTEEEKKERGRESRRKYCSKEEVKAKRKQRTQSEEYKKMMKEIQKDARVKEMKKRSQKINRLTLRAIKEQERDAYLKARKIAEEELQKRLISKQSVEQK